jgi:hypothetical protein
LPNPAIRTWAACLGIPVSPDQEVYHSCPRWAAG